MGLVWNAQFTRTDTPEVPQDHITDTVYVPRQSCGSVVGRGGAMIQQIQAETGTTVRIESGSEAAVISGATAEAVQAARDWIEGILAQSGVAAQQIQPVVVPARYFPGKDPSAQNRVGQVVKAPLLRPTITLAPQEPAGDPLGWFA